MAELSWAAIVRLVHDRANLCCEYCQTSQTVTGQAMHVEHIDPNGGDQPDNLCLSCPNCNLSKSAATEAIDPVSGQRQPLFNPRQQPWDEHFNWNDDSSRVIGKTAIGRATVERLKMNIDRIVVARHLWVRAGAHPPSRK